MTMLDVETAPVRLRKCRAGYPFPCNGECGMARQCMATVRAVSPTCMASGKLPDGTEVVCGLPNHHDGEHRGWTGDPTTIRDPLDIEAWRRETTGQWSALQQRCEVRTGADQCPEVAAYRLEWDDKTGVVCPRCLEGWVRQLADRGVAVIVHRLWGGK